MSQPAHAGDPLEISSDGGEGHSQQKMKGKGKKKNRAPVSPEFIPDPMSPMPLPDTTELVPVPLKPATNGVHEVNDTATPKGVAVKVTAADSAVATPDVQMMPIAPLRDARTDSAPPLDGDTGKSINTSAAVAALRNEALHPATESPITWTSLSSAGHSPGLPQTSPPQTTAAMPTTAIPPPGTATTLTTTTSGRSSAVDNDTPQVPRAANKNAPAAVANTAVAAPAPTAAVAAANTAPLDTDEIAIMSTPESVLAPPTDPLPQPSPVGPSTLTPSMETPLQPAALGPASPQFWDNNMSRERYLSNLKQRVEAAKKDPVMLAQVLAEVEQFQQSLNERYGGEGPPSGPPRKAPPPTSAVPRIPIPAIPNPGSSEKLAGSGTAESSMARKPLPPPDTVEYYQTGMDMEPALSARDLPWDPAAMGANNTNAAPARRGDSRPPSSRLAPEATSRQFASSSDGVSTSQPESLNTSFSGIGGLPAFAVARDVHMPEAKKESPGFSLRGPGRRKKIDTSKFTNESEIEDYVIEVGFGIEATGDEIQQYVSVLKRNLCRKVGQLRDIDRADVDKMGLPLLLYKELMRRLPPPDIDTTSTHPAAPTEPAWRRALGAVQDSIFTARERALLALLSPYHILYFNAYPDETKAAFARDMQALVFDPRATSDPFKLGPALELYRSTGDTMYLTSSVTVGLSERRGVAVLEGVHLLHVLTLLSSMTKILNARDTNDTELVTGVYTHLLDSCFAARPYINLLRNHSVEWGSPELIPHFVATIGDGIPFCVGEALPQRGGGGLEPSDPTRLLGVLAVEMAMGLIQVRRCLPRGIATGSRQFCFTGFLFDGPFVHVYTLGFDAQGNDSVFQHVAKQPFDLRAGQDVLRFCAIVHQVAAMGARLAEWAKLENETDALGKAMDHVTDLNDSFRNTPAVAALPSQIIMPAGIAGTPRLGVTVTQRNSPDGRVGKAEQEEEFRANKPVTDVGTTPGASSTARRDPATGGAAGDKHTVNESDISSFLSTMDLSDLSSSSVDAFPQPSNLGKLDKAGYTVTKTIAKHEDVIVYLATERTSSRTVAIKLVNRTATADNEPREVRILKALGGLHFTQEFVAWYPIPATQCFAMVTAYINPGKPKGKNEERKYMREMLEGIAYCHENNIIHRDIKPPNVLWDATNLRAVVIDFDCAKVFDPKNPPNSEVGTPGYMAPEIVDLKKGKRTEGYDFKVDVWSAAIVFATLVFGDKLHGRTPTREKIMKLISQAPKRVASHKLLKEMLQVDPLKRCTVFIALAHPYFTKEDPEAAPVKLTKLTTPLAP